MDRPRRERGGQALTVTAPSRTTAGYRALPEQITAANPDGHRYRITHNLAGHARPPVQSWLAGHPRVPRVFIPVGACWRNRHAAWWRHFRREALAGQRLADPDDLAHTTRVAATQCNHPATPSV